MKIGFRSYISRRDMDAARAARLQAVEIMHEDCTRARLDEVAALLAEYAIHPSAMGIYPQRGLDELKRDVDFAARIGCPVYFGHPDALRPDDAEAVRSFKAMWTEAVRYGADHGVKVAVHSCGLAPESWDIMFHEVEGLGLKYDPSFARRDGRDYRAEIRKYGGRIVHVHAKDEMCIQTPMGRTYQYAPPGMGDIHWGSVLALLYEAGYGGDIAIEVHSEFWFTEAAFVNGLILARRHLEQYMIREGIL